MSTNNNSNISLFTNSANNKISDLNINTKKILRENSLIEPVVKNPFVFKPTLKLTDKIKLTLGAILLVPIRVISILIICLIAIIVAFIITIGRSEKDLNEKPLAGWRRKLRGLLRFLGRAIAFCFGFHKIRKNGKRATRAECTIFVAAPHSSFFDAFVFFILGLPSGVSRSQNGELPFVGRLVKSAQPILVKREDKQNKLSTIEEIKRRADPNSDWPQVCIFPEGTTTNRTCLISFKPGAFIPHLPVQPVVVQYKNKLDTITWTWQGWNAYKVAFFTLCQFNNKMEITYLPVYKPNADEKENPNLYAMNVRSKMADYLNVSTTNHTYEDCRLMCRANELNLPFDSAIIEFSKLKEKLNINYDNIQELLEKYSSYARKKDGRMSLKEFCQYLDLPASDAVELVFNLYDRNKDGCIDFREFLIGLSLLSRPENTEENMKLAFAMFDKDGKNHITLNDLQSILLSSFSMPYEETKVLFEKINTNKDGLITFDEFYKYAHEKPEYAKIFSISIELKILKSNIELENLASHKLMLANNTDNSKPDEKKDSNTILSKRPLSDKSKNLTDLTQNSKSDIEIVDLTDSTPVVSNIPIKHTNLKNE